MDTQAAYGEWLSTYQWNYWSTLTFRWNLPTVDGAMRAFMRGWRALEKSKVLTAPFCWVAVEEGRLYGRVHLHALIGEHSCSITQHNKGMWLAEWWKEKYGRAQVLPYDPERKAAYYIAKYVSKKGVVQWEPMGSWPTQF